MLGAVTTLAPLPIVLSASDAATYCGVLPATLRVWRHRYHLTPHHIDGRSFYDLAELAAVLARRERVATPGLDSGL